MPIKDINRQFPPLSHEQRFACNGQLPTAPGIRRMVQGLNTSGGILRKMTLVRAERGANTAGPPSAGSSLSGVWLAYMRTGEDCAALVHHVGLVDVVYQLGDTNPRCVIDTATIAGVSFASNEIHYSTPYYPSPPLPLANDAYPDRVTHAETRVDAPADNTEYVFNLSLYHGARILYWSIAEISQDRIDDSGNVIADAGAFAVGAPIYAQDVAAALQKATTVRKHNSNYLFSWCAHQCFGNSEARTLSASYGRISTSGAVPPNAATAGWSIDLTNRGTLLRGVPITFAAFAKTASGSTNNVRLVDQSGNVLCTLSSFTTTGAWKTGTATIPTTTTRLHVEFKSDGANILELYALACVQYEA